MTIDSLNSARLTDLFAAKDTVPASLRPERAAGVQKTDAAQPDAAPSPQQLDSAIKKINKTLADMSQSLEFSVDPDSNRTIVKVIDLHTKEVIRQIPSQETLDIAKALESAQGLLLKQRA